MVKPVEYLLNLDIKKKIDDGFEYQKKDVTLLRRITPDEEGHELLSFVKDKKDGSIRRELAGSMSGAVSVLARNPDPIGKDAQGMDLFNEWLIPLATLIKNYGQVVSDNLTTEFVGHKKKATLHAIPIDSDVLEILTRADCVDADGNIYIKVSWTDEPMIAREGDFLTDQTYSISAHNMDGYELVGAAASAKPSSYSGAFFAPQDGCSRDSGALPLGKTR